MGIFIDIGILAGGLEYLNATRMSVAAEGLTEANNKKRVHPVSIPSVPPSIRMDGYFYWYRYLDGGEVTNYKLQGATSSSPRDTRFMQNKDGTSSAVFVSGRPGGRPLRGERGCGRRVGGQIIDAILTKVCHPERSRGIRSPKRKRILRLRTSCFAQNDRRFFGGAVGIPGEDCHTSDIGHWSVYQRSSK